MISSYCVEVIIKLQDLLYQLLLTLNQTLIFFTPPPQNKLIQ